MHFGKELDILEKKLWFLKGERNANIKELKTLIAQLDELKEEKKLWEECNALFKNAALLTQQEFINQIEKIAQLVLNFVLGEKKYCLKVDLELKHSKNSAKIYLVKDGVILPPLQTSGGIAELAAFSLILALFRVTTRERESILFLDEPFKSLKGNEYPAKAAAILYSLAHKLGIQIVIISHSHVQIEYADTIYRIEQKNKKSEAILEKGNQEDANTER